VKLDDQLCFALYSASKAMTARYRPALEQLGVTYPQFLVLMALWEDDDQTVGALCARVGLDSGTMSPLLKRLAAIELVTRHRPVEDERQVRIQLTEAGRALEQPACGVSEMMIGVLGLGSAEVLQLTSRLETITARVGRS